MPVSTSGNAVSCQGIGGIAGAGAFAGISWAPAARAGSRLAAASSTATVRIRRDRIGETSSETDTHIGQDYLLRRLTSLPGYVSIDLDVELRAVSSAPALAALGLAHQRRLSRPSRASISPPATSPVGANPIRA